MTPHDTAAAERGAWLAANRKYTGWSMNHFFRPEAIVSICGNLSAAGVQKSPTDVRCARCERFLASLRRDAAP